MRFNLKTNLKNALNKLGPGFITGASDDDPAGIATYSEAGAAFGLATLWTALVTAPLMIAIQEMCARIGIVTQNGIIGNIRNNYSRSVLYLILLMNFPAIVFNIGADIAAIGAVSNLLMPKVPAVMFNVVFTVLLIVALIKFPYRKIVSLLKWLCLALLSYFIAPFLMKINWEKVLLHTVLPTITLNKSFVLILVAILGTTISPYLFFWQSAQEVESAKQRLRHHRKEQAISHMHFDVQTGIIFSNLAMFFIILTTGTVLFQAGISHITTVDQAAVALRPLAGNFTYLLFAFGIIGSGLLAIPVLASTLSYIFTEARGVEESLDRQFHEAKGFYLILILSLVVGIAINLLGMSPIRMLIYSAVLYGLITPVVIALILHIGNNRNIMGKYVNGRISNALGSITLALMTIAAVALVYFMVV